MTRKLLYSTNNITYETIIKDIEIPDDYDDYDINFVITDIIKNCFKKKQRYGYYYIVFFACDLNYFKTEYRITFFENKFNVEKLGG